MENIERVRQYIRQTNRINPQPATIDEGRAQGTTINLDNTTGQTAVSIDHHQTTTNCICSTIDDENDIEEIPLEPSRRNDK